MKRLRLLAALLVMPLLTASAQVTEAPEGATISSAQVSGLDLARLSPGLQKDIAALAGKPLVRETLRLLAARIEAEQPRFVAAVRAVLDLDGEVRVVFVVARIRDSEANINTRYIVESVEIKGVPEADVSKQLRDDLQRLVGRRLDSDEAEQLETRLKESLPDYDVRRRIRRGSQQGHIRLVFELSRSESTRWLHFEPLKSKFLYHSDQGWGGYLDLPIGGRDVRVTPSFAIDNRDDLIEEYSGFGIRLETRKIGTERLGASLEWSTFDQTWQSTTLAAIDVAPGIPAAYEQRSTVASLVTFALTRHFGVSAGVSISELEPLSMSPESQMANAAIASIGYEQRWKQTSGSSHDIEARFAVRAASDALESDLVYTRYFGNGSYWYRWAKHTVLASGMAGTLSGEAPLFERFSLGDSTTLRGWNKYDIAPAGGDRMFHASLEYRYGGLALFLDAGSVWDHDTNARIRVATGVGFHSGPVFVSSFPLNTDDLSAVFTMGIRFSVSGYRNIEC
jgi:hypothetical protein